MKYRLAALAVAGAILGSSLAAADDFLTAFPPDVERPWPGPQFWTNPLEDWRIADGRLEVVRSGPNRNVHVLTRAVAAGRGTLEMSVTIGRADEGAAPASAGFRLGIRSELGDYRSALLHGRGLDAGIDAHGALFIAAPDAARSDTSIGNVPSVKLTLTAEPESDRYRVALAATDASSGRAVASVEAHVPAEELVGNLALVNHYEGRDARASQRRGPRHWFRGWNISGTKVEIHEDRAWGPILFAMHTLSRGTMKMTAQLAPVAASDPQTVRLEVQDQDGNWQTSAESRIDSLARTATFRVENWDDARDTPYRVAYRLTLADGATKTFYWAGTVRRDPVDRPLIVAGFTGNTDAGFPNARLVRNVGIHNPDVMVFTGDQIYESVGGYGVHRGPTPLATLNYLRKWYLLGWAFGDLMRDRVTLCLPDDHDVYQPNVWGNGGNHVEIENHPRGGYDMPPEWINMVQRTQTSHHPDPYDPTPIQQGIGVYYGDMLYGRVSFAVIEDRKFKSGPQDRVNTWPGRPDHVTDPDFDPKSVDAPGLKLLGDRQLEFLRRWAADWRDADLKIVCSQTIFCNLANYHGPQKTFLVADLDSNGWPQSGRNRALEAIRRGFGFMLAGDQHLASIVHHGIDEHGDAGFSFCVPSIAAGYPRAWRPDQEGRPVGSRKPDAPPNTGDYVDGLGNLVTVHAIGNPEPTNRPGVLATLHDKASGYAIVRLDQQTRDITMECWRLLVDVSNPRPGDQFPGWPMVINMLDNYARRPTGYLATIETPRINNPVVQVVDETRHEIVYTLRIVGSSFRPMVFGPGPYTVEVSLPESGQARVLSGLRPDNGATISIDLAPPR